MDQAQVFEFLSQQHTAGMRCVLVTICFVEGASMRDPGTLMGVSEDGTFAGSLSGGCIENAVVAEALAALEQGTPRLVRFGAGSRYLDVRLPCGGGLDIHFQPLSSGKFMQQCRAALDARMPFSIKIGSGHPECLPGLREDQFDRDQGVAVFACQPRLRLVIIGHGAGVEALAILGQSIDCEIEVLTPDQRVHNQLEPRSIPVTFLERTSDVHLLSSDAWTAIVFLFHDHDWELALMRHALSLPHFYLGAMGGRRAHMERCNALRASGVAEQAIASICAPIGLFHSSRNPQTLALSTLAQVVDKFQVRELGAAIRG